ncbi:MAG: DegV family protein [Coriobacteriales bacterium]|jgi:DegV family protein with EDD domain|nr:DegV family protein [Coriobacteriales bacterium]
MGTVVDTSDESIDTDSGRDGRGWGDGGSGEGGSGEGGGQRGSGDGDSGEAGSLDLYTDDSCNLPREWLATHRVGLLPLSVTLDGRDYPSEQRDDPAGFYAAIRQGARPSTSAIPKGQIEEAFGKSLERGRDILYIGLPAKLSSNFTQVQDIAGQIAAGCTQQVCCMDARVATMGQGLLVKEAVRLRDAGESLEAMRTALENLSDHVRILFMLDDPQFLKVGGRGEEALEWVARFISKLSVKPLLTINRQCAIKFHSAYRSRKRALNQMMEYLRSMIDHAHDQVVYVLHADIPRLAEIMVDAVQETLGIGQQIAVAEVSPVIGAHVGPGTVALVFVSTEARN